MDNHWFSTDGFYKSRIVSTSSRTRYTVHRAEDSQLTHKVTFVGIPKKVTPVLDTVNTGKRFLSRPTKQGKNKVKKENSHLISVHNLAWTTTIRLTSSFGNISQLS